MTVVKTNDNREDGITFADVSIGDLFTSVGRKAIFIKTETLYDGNKNVYNTVGLDGEFYWSDDDEEIQPIREIEITIKK